MRGRFASAEGPTCGRQDGWVPSSFTLVTETAIPAPALFDLSLDIDAHLSSMSQTGERAVAGVTTGRIGLGDTVTWRARHFGIWWTLTSKITVLDRPTHFVDQQVRGPFKSFIHEHRFEQLDDRSRMTDLITVASPIFGSLAERLVLVPYLRRLIAKRNAHLVTALSRVGEPRAEPPAIARPGSGGLRPGRALHRSAQEQEPQQSPPACSARNPAPTLAPCAASPLSFSPCSSSGRR